MISDPRYLKNLHTFTFVGLFVMEKKTKIGFTVIAPEALMKGHMVTY